MKEDKGERKYLILAVLLANIENEDMKQIIGYPLSENEMYVKNTH